MFSRVGDVAIRKGLDNTWHLCEVLGNPHKNFKSIHIAGTNGKGSVSHMLAAVLQTAGYKTGLYTSPHLKDFRERIKVGGILCDESFVIDFTERIMPLIDELQPSFFEITVAMAFDYFSQKNIDVAVIEVGLGGRLDSTNVITPELSVITNIGFDHMNLLGNTLDKIAFEKAGIIKSGVPVVIGEWLPETRPVFEQTALENNAPISFAKDILSIADWKYEHHQLIVEIVHHEQDARETYHLDLPGVYQTKNLITLLETIHQLNLQGWNLSAEVVKKALQQVRKTVGLHGRWEIIHHHPDVVLDVGHNVDGIKQIVQQLEQSNYNHLHIVFGMVKDKDVSGVLQLLPHYATYYFTKAGIERALDETQLQNMASAYRLKGETYPDVNIALKAATDAAKKEDLILVCGSVFLVGEVMV